MKIYDFGIILTLLILGWTVYGLSHVNDIKNKNIMSLCDERDNTTLIYKGVLIECNKEN